MHNNIYSLNEGVLNFVLFSSVFWGSWFWIVIPMQPMNCCMLWGKKVKWLLNFYSSELKVKWTFLITYCLSVCLSICPSINFSLFTFLSRTTGPISTKLGTKHPWVKGIQVCFYDGQTLFLSKSTLWYNHKLWANLFIDLN